MMRVWCEHLDYERARTPEVLDLLESGSLHPIFAVKPDTDLEELAGLLDDVDERGLEAAIWPLLDESAGYWPSVRNVDRFADLLFDYLDGLEAEGRTPRWVAFDLEPALEGGDGFADSIERAARRSLLGNLCRRPFDRAVERYDEMVGELRERGIESLGVTAPTAAADLGGVGAVWQRALEVPWSGVSWARAGIMAYGSMTAGYTRGWLDYRDVRAIYYPYLKHLVDAFGERAHVSLGITGTGVFGDEPVYESPGPLRRDVAAARAAGIDDIAIFSLEGILEKDAPKRWTEALCGVEPEIPPTTWRGALVRTGLDTIKRALQIGNELR